MEQNATTVSSCRGELTIAEMLALLRDMNNVSTTPSPVQQTSSKYVSFILITVVSSVVVIVNFVLLLAIFQVKKINTYLRLVISLSISDMLVGIRVLFGSLDIKAFSGHDVELCTFVTLRGIKMTSHLISLFNLLGLGLDHYCAIVQPIKYKSQMSATRTNVMIVTFWVISALCGFSDFFIPSSSYAHCHKSSLTDTINTQCLLSLDNYTSYSAVSDFNTSYSFNGDDYSSTYDTGTTGMVVDQQVYNDARLQNEAPDPTNAVSMQDEFWSTSMDYYTSSSETPNNLTEEGFCYKVMCSRYDTEYLVFSLAAILLLIMSFIYTRVCVKIYSLRHLLRGRSRRTFRRNKKGLITTICIVGSFMICWLPFGIFTSYTLLSMSLHPQKSEVYYLLLVQADQYLYALLLLNSLCDPIIYALRMREVKIGYHQLLGRCCRIDRFRNRPNNGYSSSYHLTSQYASRVIHPNELSTRIHGNSLMFSGKNMKTYNDSLRMSTIIKNESAMPQTSTSQVAHVNSLIIVKKGVVTQGNLNGEVI